MNTRPLTGTFVLLFAVIQVLTGGPAVSAMGTGSVEDTNIEVRKDALGKYHAVKIGASGTTLVEAVLDSRGVWSIAYHYSDSHALEVRRLSVKTSEGLTTLMSKNPVRTDDGKGTVTESETLAVSRELFEEMIRGDSPVIFIEGDKGRVIIETGTESRENLKDLLDFAESGP